MRASGTATEKASALLWLAIRDDANNMLWLAIRDDANNMLWLAIRDDANNMLLHARCGVILQEAHRERIDMDTPSANSTDSINKPSNHPEFDAFVATVAALRAPDGCPWDREQTHESIAKNMIEEAYEAVETIEEHDTTHLREELGDVLLQVVLQSQIAADAGEFTIDDVCRDVNAKMIRRHPHVFGEAQAANAAEVLNLWDQVKLAEQDTANEAACATGEVHKGLLDGVPTKLPALMQAQSISRKAASAGFDWDALGDEHITSVGLDWGVPGEAGAKAVVAEEELGDALFSLTNTGQRMGIDAESALRATCDRFRQHWRFMEAAAQKGGCRVEDLTPDERELLWNESKTKV